MVGSKDKTLKLYEGGFHDLLNDLDKGRAMQDIQDWIGARRRAKALPVTSTGTTATRERERGLVSDPRP
jgi:hypothetical protein